MESLHNTQLWTKNLGQYQRWLKASNRRKSTIDTRSWWVRNLAKSLDWKPAQDITTEEILTWATDQDWAPSTRKSAITSVKSFYLWASTTSIITDNPCATIAPVRVPRAKSRPTPDTVLSEALKRAANTEEKLMLFLAAYAGLRRFEIASLHTRDVDAGWMSVHGKGGTTRIVPVHPVLLELLALKTTGYYFPGRFTGHRHPDYIGRRISKMLGPGYTAHNLRHWFASTAFKNTRNIRAVQELLGHANVSTTQIYVDIPYDDLVTAVFALPFEAA